ncbi:MAG: zinc ribbon domain-containing protein [Ruminococcaceae bacterium]|nr:zinc ribbon domain-containing protein [Oscillospiraceae bacterium]
MFCTKCGAPIENGSKFCTKCGQPTDVAAEKKDNVETKTEATAQNGASKNSNANAEKVAAAANEFAKKASDAAGVAAKKASAAADIAAKKADEAAGFAAEKLSKISGKKISKTLVTIVASVLVVAILAGVVALASGGLGMPSNPDKYMAKVEEQSILNAVDTATSAYGEYLQMLEEKSYAFGGTAVLSVNEDILDFIGAFADIDLSWLENVSFTVDEAVSEKFLNFATTIKLNEKILADAGIIVDFENEELYLLSDILTEAILVEGLGDFDYESFEKIMSMDFAKMLPSEKEINKYVEKYLKIVLKYFSDVEKEKDTVKAEGVEQKLTLYTYELTEEKLCNIAVEVLETFEKDKGLKKLLEETINNVAEAMEEDVDADEILDQIYDQIPDILDTLEESEPGDSVLIKLTDYVNSKHEIVGRKIRSGGQTILEYVLTKDGKDFGFKLKTSGDYITIEGKGTESRGVWNGEFDIVAPALDLGIDDIGTIVLEDFEMNEKVMKGSVSLVPSDEMLNAMMYDVPSAFASMLSDFSLRLDLDAKWKKKSEMTLSLMNDDDPWISISVSGEEKKFKKPSIPSETVDVEDIDIDIIDFDELMDRLETAGVPDDILDLLNLAELMGGGMSYDSADSYYGW